MATFERDGRRTWSGSIKRTGGQLGERRAEAESHFRIRRPEVPTPVCSCSSDAAARGRL